MSRRAVWLGVAGVASITASPWFRPANGRLVTMARALMPWAGLAGWPLALLAARSGHRRAALASTVTAAATVAMCIPLVRHRRRRPPSADASPLRVLHANLLYVNRNLADVPPALRPLDADVVTFSEYTSRHAAQLRRSWLCADYPHAVERSARGASGTALWSRYPISERPTTRTKHHTVVADVHTPAGDVTVIVIHTQSPMVHHGDWLNDLNTLAAQRVDGPAVMTGDFNAGWWHPEFRAVLAAASWRDAHIACGRGLSCSWPTERWNAFFKWHPPFTRLDHALISPDLDLFEVVDVHVPGSDHVGLVVSVAPGAPAAP